MDARLIVQNWRGSTNGGGLPSDFWIQHLGSSPQQLSQILFRDPAGLQLEDYSARILSTGEIVPAPRTPLPLLAPLHQPNHGRATPILPVATVNRHGRIHS